MNRLLLVFALGAFALTPTLRAEHHEKGAEPFRISHGAEVQLADYVVSGKTTIFDFTSDYCPSCREIAPKLEALHKSREDIAVVKIDVNRPGIKRIDWQSPVAHEFHIEALPQFKIFDPAGKLIAEGDEAEKTIDSWVK